MYLIMYNVLKDEMFFEKDKLIDIERILVFFRLSV